MDYSPRLPLKFDAESGNYEMVSEPVEEIRQNLKMIVLCNKGDKVGDYNFGVGLYGLLFEQQKTVKAQQKISEIYEQVARYLPIVELTDVQLNFEMIEAFDSTTSGSGSFLPGWVAKIYFSVPEFGYDDFLEV